jgi:hypothetical protein
MKIALLLVIIALGAWQLLRLHRQMRIIRHLFIESSDWAARTIDEIVESASFEICEAAVQAAKARGSDMTLEDARGYIPDLVSTAKANWINQKERFQAMLSANHIRPLEQADLDDLILADPPWLKRVPHPQRVTRVG